MTQIRDRHREVDDMKAIKLSLIERPFFGQRQCTQAPLAKGELH
jgi:hypothetical protein